MYVTVLYCAPGPGEVALMLSVSEHNTLPIKDTNPSVDCYFNVRQEDHVAVAGWFTAPQRRHIWGQRRLTVHRCTRPSDEDVQDAVDRGLAYAGGQLLARWIVNMVRRYWPYSTQPQTIGAPTIRKPKRQKKTEQPLATPVPGSSFNVLCRLEDGESGRGKFILVGVSTEDRLARVTAELRRITARDTTITWPASDDLQMKAEWTQDGQNYSAILTSNCVLQPYYRLVFLVRIREEPAAPAVAAVPLVDY